MKLKIVAEEIFYFFTAALVIFFLMEIIRPRIVLAYLNLNWLLSLWLIFALLALLMPREEE